MDAVLSIGGGSALHTAKLLVYLAKTPGRLDDIYGVYLAAGKRLPLLRVPTTASTGYEVTPIVIVATPNAEKKVVFSRPHQAVGDHLSRTDAQHAAVPHCRRH
ncbi:iron-containing alcohol dehydrogenase [Rhizobium laguerreae]|uniref:iron-containing alcohol dehydrogenase n=1 Tax=Rhizobium laguerreae TaxID=1076926 RepID=UPI0036F1CC5A